MTLKTQNLPLISLYTVINFSIFIVLYTTGDFTLENFENILNNINTKDGIFFTILPILLIVLIGIIPFYIKEILVFWKVKNRLPGCQAFTKYVNKDNRINKKYLKSKFGNFPDKPDKQNQLWYKIFKTISDSTIDKTHKDFLLNREICTLTLIFLILPFILLIFTDINLVIVGIYTIFILFEYFIFRYIAKNHAERLVMNVLALASTK